MQCMPKIFCSTIYFVVSWATIVSITVNILSIKERCLGCQNLFCLRLVKKSRLTRQFTTVLVKSVKRPSVKRKIIKPVFLIFFSFWTTWWFFSLSQCINANGLKMQRTNGSCLVTTTSTVFKGEKVESIAFENDSNRSPFSASEQLDILLIL